MPIINKTIELQITALIENTSSTELIQSKKDFASGLAGIIATAIKSATVTVAPGIPVATTGTAVAQTGATISAGTGTLS